MPKTTQPISSKRLAANRANAGRSTGPRTHQGKARSTQNSRKHGFAASKFCAVRLEDFDEFAILHAKAIATYRPVNDQEQIAVERIAIAQQSLYRCAALEAGLTTSAMNETLSPDANLLTDTMTHGIQVTADQNHALCFAMGFERLVRRSDAWKYFLRYSAQAERHHRRAIEEFERLKAQRSELPNEPTSDAELAEIASLAHPQPPPVEPIEPTEPTPPPPPPPDDGDPTVARTMPLHLLHLQNRSPKRGNHSPQ